MSDCLFCKIIEGEIPAEKVYESENIIGFRDINPVGPIHVLFVPKKHYPTLNDVPEVELPMLCDIMKGALEVAKKEGIDKTGYRIVSNINKDAGQEVFHLHVHLIGGKKLGKMG